MSRRIRIGLLTLVVLFFWGTAATAAVKEINAQDLKTMMEKDNVVVVFPLSSIEFNDIHIPDSLNISIEALEKRLPADKETKLAFYCLGRQ